MKNLEYKIIEFNTGVFKHDQSSDHGSFSFREMGEKKGMLGGMKNVAVPLSIKRMEEIFNDLGKQGWSLCETVPFLSVMPSAFMKFGTRTTSVQFIFKREI